MLSVSRGRGEGVQVELVACVDGGDPVVKAVTMRAGEDLGELGDVAGELVQVRAVLPARARPVFSSRPCPGRPGR